MTTAAPISVMSRISGCASIQPRMPPARASTAMPSRGSGCPPNRWHRPETVRSSSPTPMPMRVLSCTELGCRKSHTAKSSMTTGRANATRPKSPPKVHESSAWAMGSLMKNHSTTAPAIASTTMKKGSPSRRSSLASVSGPSARAAPPVTCASPIQARTSSGGRSGVADLALAARRCACARRRELLRGGRLGARAARGRARGTPVRPGARSHAPTLRPTGDARRQDAASVRDRRTARRRPREATDAARRAPRHVQPSTRTMVSRPAPVPTTAKPSDR